MPSFGTLAPAQPTAPVEETVPVEGAPPVQQAAPAPAPTYTEGSFGAFAPENQNYTAPPEEAPTNYIPGSTYSPTPLSEAAQQPVAPPPAQPNTKVESGIPTDPFSGIGDVAGSIRDNLAAGDLKSAAMNFLDAPGLANQNERNIVAQRAKDAALHGTPDYSTGNIGPSGFLESPENIPANIGHGLMTTVSEFEGMPDWVPSSTEEQSIEFYRNNPEKVKEAQAREQTEGVAAWYNVWNEAQGNTLETGGLWGLGRDAIRGGADPLNLGAAAATGVGTGASTVLRNAGYVGAARGTEFAVKGGNIAIDPLFEGGSTLVGKALSPFIPNIFKPGEQVAGRIGQEKVVEGVATAVQDVRANPGAPAAPVGPFIPPAPPAGPREAVPLPLPESGTVGPNITHPTGPISPYEPSRALPEPAPNTPSPAGRAVPVDEADQAATNARIADETRLTRQRAEAARQGPTPYNPGPRDLVRGPSPIDGRERTQFPDGTVPTVAQMEGARKRLLNVHPNEFEPGQYNTANSQNTLWRGVMTQERYMLDGWSPNRIADAQMKMRDKSLTEAERINLRQELQPRIDAGKRFTTFLGQRVKQFGDLEIQRVLDNIQREADDRLARGMPANDALTNAENRIAVLEAAMEQVGANQSFEVVVGGIPIRRYGDTNTFLRPRPVGPSSSVLPDLPNPYREVANGTILGFPDPGDLQLGARLLERMGINPAAKSIASDPNFLSRFTRMILDPEGFRHTGPDARKAIEQRRLDGEITDFRAEQLLDYLDVRTRLYRTNAVGKGGSDDALPVFRAENAKQINWEIMKREHDRLTANWENPFTGRPTEAPFDPELTGIKLEEMRRLDELDPDVIRERAAEPSRTLETTRGGWRDAPPLTDLERERVSANPQLKKLREAGYSQETYNELRKVLDDMGLKDVSLRMEQSEADALFDMGEALITISPLSGFGQIQKVPIEHFKRVLNHEAVHAFRTMGLIRDDEWDVLVKAAREYKDPETTLDRSFVDEIGWKYKEEDLAREGISADRLQTMRDEEGVAQMFAAYRMGKTIRPEHQTIIQRIFDLVNTFLGKIKGTEAAKVMDRMASGEVGSRTRLPRDQWDYYRTSAPDIDSRGAVRGVEIRPEPDGSFGVYHDGNRISTATTEAQANVLANRVQMAAAEAAPSTRRIDDLGDPGPNMPKNPVQQKAQQQTAANKSIFTDPQLDHAARYPNLTAKLDDAAVSRGKESLTSRLRRARMAMKSNTTRMRAMGDMDLPDVGDPELDNSGMAYGMKVLLRQIDTDFPLRIENQQVPIYTYIKQQMEIIDNLGMLRKSIDPKNTRAMRYLKDLEEDYAPDLGELDFYNLTPREMDEVVTLHVSRKWAESVNKGKPNVAKAASNRYGIAGDIGRMIKNMVDFRRGVGLTNWIAAPRQILNQLFGNAWGVFMAKPSAILEMGNMRELRRHVQRLHATNPSTAPNTMLQNVMNGYGAKAPNTMIMSRGDRTQAGHEVQVEGALGRLRDFVAPKWLRDWVSGPDELAKGAVAGKSFRTGMRREVDALPTNAKLTSARMATKRQGMDAITAQIERKLPPALETFRTDHFDRPMFTGEQLEATIKEIFDADVKRGVVDRESLRVYADRMKRDWNTVVNSEKQYAAQEAKRVMFSWDNTRADDIIQNIFLYHYWATRAGFLYSKEMLKKPWLMTLYMDAAEQIQAEAEQGEYPNWMKGFTRILNSPLGVALFMSPLDMISTAFHLNEMEMGATDGMGDDTLTQLGQLKGMFPFVWNPALEMALTIGGAFGPGASMPNNMTGLNRLTGFAADVINYANYNGMLPGNLGKDAMGNPVPVAPRFLDDVILKVAGHFGMPVVPSSSSFEKETTAYLYDQLSAKYGLMDPAQMNSMVAEIYERAKQGDMDPMLYAAQADALANSMQGPEFGWLPESLRPIVGAAIRYTSPVRLTARSETGFLIQYPGAQNTLPSGNESILSQMSEAGYDEYDIKATKRSLFQTQRARSLDVAYQDWWDGGNPELADKADMFHDIGQNRIGTALMVGDEQYTPADINAMSEGERYDLAEDWLAEQGYTRADLDALDAYKDEVIAKNPDVGGYLAFQNYVKGYPGGVEAFVDEAVKTSPSFASYMSLQGAPGTPQYYEFADSRDAYFAISGEKSSIYGFDNTPDAGYIPGLPMGTNFVTKYQTDKAIDDATKGGSNEFTKFVETVQTDVNRIYAAQDWLNTNYPGTSLLLEGQWLDKSLYNAMKDAGVAPPKLEDAGAAYEYYTWLENNATAADLSVEAFLDQREGSGTSWEDLPDATPQMIGDQRGFATQQAQPIAKDDLKNIGIASAVTQYSPIYTGPSTGNAVSLELPAGAPVKEVYRGQDGWSQVYVTMVGGSYKIGWVPTASLQAA